MNYSLMKSNHLFMFHPLITGVERHSVCFNSGIHVSYRADVSKYIHVYHIVRSVLIMQTLLYDTYLNTSIWIIQYMYLSQYINNFYANYIIIALDWGFPWRTYIEGRSIYGKSSDTAPVGSALGLLLFLVFINDLPSNVRLLKMTASCMTAPLYN